MSGHVRGWGYLPAMALPLLAAAAFLAFVGLVFHALAQAAREYAQPHGITGAATCPRCGEVLRVAAFQDHEDDHTVEDWLEGRRWLVCVDCSRVLDPADDVEARCRVTPQGGVEARCVPCSDAS